MEKKILIAYLIIQSVVTLVIGVKVYFLDQATTIELLNQQTQKTENIPLQAVVGEIVNQLNAK
jgi:hypothetical protein